MDSSITVNMDDISLAIGLVSLVLSIVFYLLGLKSSYQSSQTLTKIDEQVKTLRMINDTMIKNALEHFTASNDKLIVGILDSNSRLLDSPESKKNEGSIIDSYIIMYSYITKSYVLANEVLRLLPSSNDSSVYQKTARMSSEDIRSCSEILKNFPSKELQSSSLYNEYIDTQKRLDEYRGN